MSPRPLDTEFSMPSLRLDGRVALVTGGGRGLGLGMALALAHAGADVAIAARTAEQVDQATALITGLERRTLGVAIDVTEDAAPQRLVDAVLNHFGRLDILVHAAGINIRKAALELSPDEVARVLRVNVEAPFRLSQAAAPAMKGQGHGRIIAVTSISAEVAIPRVSAYAMSKGALRQMVRALAVEWARDGITVNAIAPGRFWTAMTDAVFSDERLHAGAVRVIPMGRPGVASDLAGATVLLASDASAYITGQTIVIDGGWLAGGGVEG
jgi:NAD(P)-dependent dehydrogenase (short-subunit alcohol dehydrogenase family)